MSRVYFITHPDVVIDLSIAVPEWKLSPIGLERMQHVTKQPWIDSIQRLFSSPERKAKDGADVLSRYLRIPYTEIAALGENDRSSTGYLPAAEFESVADEFFQNAGQSVRGWETALDAQNRIVGAVEAILENNETKGSLVIVSHGAVGTLLLCKLSGWQISREHDQPGGGGGNFFAFESVSREVVHGWKPVEETG